MPVPLLRWGDQGQALADGEEVRNKAAGDTSKWTRAERPAMALSLKGHDPMTVTLGILAMLEAKPGKGGELESFLKAGRELAVAEEGTVTWYAFKISDTSYGIFDTFATDDARTAHINGQIPAALATVSADLLASEPDIRPVDVVAVK